MVLSSSVRFLPAYHYGSVLSAGIRQCRAYSDGRTDSAGRVGVLGGSGDYSGAPFFSAFGAMRFGADLAHVLCEPEAGNVIKT